MSDIPIIGFIGLGYMGHGMAGNLLAKGYTLWVKGNVNRTPIDSLIGHGAHEAQSPRDMVKHCDIIHICLSNSAQVEAVIRGPEGILAGAKEGLIVIDTTTADPVSTLALAEEMAAQGMTLVDAPLGRTPKEAEAGTLDAMVGCSEEMFKIVHPVISCWAATVTRIGEVGSGHKMKLLMNFLASSYAALYSEALSLGAAVGISPHTFRDVMEPSRLGSGFMGTFLQYACDRDENAHKFTIDNMAKDIRYVNDMASAAGVMNIMAAATRHYYTHAVATGGGADYVPMLSDHVAGMNGLDLTTLTNDDSQ